MPWPSALKFGAENSLRSLREREDALCVLSCPCGIKDGQVRGVLKSARKTTRYVR